MICKDMKYTALYWVLRFFEREEDIHVKDYGAVTVRIDAERQTADYGRIRVLSEDLHFLKRHKDFVILECVDRLLQNGVLPEKILLDGRKGRPDIVAGKRKIRCEQWGEDYERALVEKTGDTLIYTSRLVSGLLEYRTSEMAFRSVDAGPDFDVRNDELLFYKGQSPVVRVPDGIRSVAASAFWNNVYVREVILPDSLERLGGDCFYRCTNLEKVNIPENVRAMGNDPFAGCPKLRIKNESPFFRLEDGVLYSADRNTLIHYSIGKAEKGFRIPGEVVCIGKHSFFLCDALEKIVIPSGVERMENNPFSGCTRLSLENHSPRYIVEDGIIYNAYRSAIIGCLNGTVTERFSVPESVTLISRNSFWNCQGIRNIVIGGNVKRIGYNPFAGCENLLLESKAPDFPCIGGIVYDRERTHILCATDRAVGESFSVPDGVTHINRGVFSGCRHLKHIDFNGVCYIDKSAFTNCVSLKEVYVPDTVGYIGEWAFANCASLERISIPRETFVDRNAFNECHAFVQRREK